MFGGFVPAMERGRSEAPQTFDEYIFPPLMRLVHQRAGNGSRYPGGAGLLHVHRGGVRHEMRAAECLYTAGLAGVSPEDARALQKNPLDASRHAKILGDALRLAQDPTAITRAGLRLQEGEDDARTVLKKYDCDSTAAVRLRTNLNALVIARKNMPVEPGNNAKLIAMMNPAYRTAQGIELPATQPPTPLESTVSACHDWSKAMVKKFPMGVR